MERCTSYGRGGAGNLRRKSEAEAAAEVIKNSPPEDRQRRSSIWSNAGSGTTSRRASIVEAFTSTFRRNSKTSDDDMVKE